MSLDRAAVINRIEAILDASTTPSFRVIVGNPIGLPPDGGPYVTFAYRGRTDPPEGPATIGNKMDWHRFEVTCFWNIQPEASTIEGLENEVWQAGDTLRAALWADATLKGLATDIWIDDVNTDEEFFPVQAARENRVVLYRTLSFELRIKDLEGDAI